MEAGTIYRRVAGRQGRRELHPRGLHRRGDRAAAAVRALLHPGRAGAREDPGPDHRPQVLRQVPEGDRLRRRHAGLRARARRRSGRGQARHLASSACRPSLKISVHTGSDKFSLYPIINRALAKHGAGLHLKTAGTTWLEEVIGVALSGPGGLAVAKKIYLHGAARASTSSASPTRPSSRSIAPSCRPPAAIDRWSADDLVSRLRHDQSNPAYDRHLRQFVHVAFRVAAEMGAEWTGALEAAREVAGRCVTGKSLRPSHSSPVSFLVLGAVVVPILCRHERSHVRTPSSSSGRAEISPTRRSSPPSTP